MPRAWLHRHTRKTRMTTELTIKRSDNPSNDHPKFKKGGDGSTSVPVHRRRRLVSQSGRIQVSNSNISRLHLRYFGDLFTTILDLPFHWIIVIYSVVYLASWSGFGTIWWLFDRIRRSEGYGEYYCVDNVDSWTTAFLFSIETQTTIGYGGRQITSDCPEGIILLLIQTLVGSFIAATLLGIVFAKASRPKKRSETILFSKKAVIGKRDDRLCFMLRVANLRKSQLLECHIQAELFYTRETKEGEIPYFHEPLTLGNGFNEGEENYYTCLLLPNVIVHVIDQDSPLYKMNRLDMLQANVEVVVILEGVIESTGLTMQARTSYAANEIVWGYNFASMPREGCPVLNGHLMLDFKDFEHRVTVRDMPMCSAEEYGKGSSSAAAYGGGAAMSNGRNTKGTALSNDTGSPKSLSTNEEATDEISDGCEVIPNGLATTSGLQEKHNSGIEMNEIS